MSLSKSGIDRSSFIFDSGVMTKRLVFERIPNRIMKNLKVSEKTGQQDDDIAKSE
jgi:hypothetical protein